MLHCNNGNQNHYHLTLEEAQKCFGTTVLYVSNVPIPSNGSLVARVPQGAAWQRPDAPWRSKEVKDSQLEAVKRLNGSLKKAKEMNRGQCSDYIDGLKTGLISPEPDPDERYPISAPPVSVSAPPVPVSAPPVIAPVRVEPTVAKRETKVLTPLLSMVPDGYYAAQLDEKMELHFIRISRPKSGEYKDCVKIQKMYGTGPGSSDYRLNNAFVLWPSGRVSVYMVSLEDPINLIIADHKAAARLYSKEKKRCLMCNAELTDPVSRKYGVGPECIKTPYGARIKAEVDDAELMALES